MGIEIERKFLVRDVTVLLGAAGTTMRQGYLSTDPDRTVRVRLAGTRGFITIKGAASADGKSRAEYEFEIPAADAGELLDRLALRPLIEKTRYRISHDGATWEVDVFSGANEGLVVAEIEVPSAATPVALPPWVGGEVTGDARYYNASLVGRPYSEWPEH